MTETDNTTVIRNAAWIASWDGEGHRYLRAGTGAGPSTARSITWRSAARYALPGGDPVPRRWRPRAAPVRMG